MLNELQNLAKQKRKYTFKENVKWFHGLKPLRVLSDFTHSLLHQFIYLFFWSADDDFSKPTKLFILKCLF